MLAIALQDKNSNVSKNVEYIREVSKLDPLTAPKYQIVQETNLCCIPEGEEWRCAQDSGGEGQV